MPSTIITFEYIFKNNKLGNNNNEFLKNILRRNYCVGKSVNGKPIKNVLKYRQRRAFNF